VTSTLPEQPAAEQRSRRNRGGSPWPEARRLAGTAPRPLPPRAVGLTEAIGCVLAEPLVAASHLPAYDNSAMDGWAVSGAPPWRVVGEVPAGRVRPWPLQPGECVAIATGGVLPSGADAVVPVEEAEQDGTTVRPLPASGKAKPHIRFAGEEARAGDPLLVVGTLVTPPVAGLAAAVGLDTLRVRPKARVAVRILGDEVTTSGCPSPGCVRDALGPQLPAWVTSMGAEMSGPPAYVPDDVARLTEAITDADADLVLTTGSTSVGARDHLHRVLADLGARVVVDGVDVKPGHPMLLAVLPDGRWVAGLPGNPLAACVALITLVQPLLDRMHGRQPTAAAAVTLLEAQPARQGDGHRLLPVDRAADVTAAVLPSCGSAMLRGLAQATGLAVVPPYGAEAGDKVEYLPLPWADRGR
jgi:molybdopterin molybdotransferase